MNLLVLDTFLAVSASFTMALFFFISTYLLVGSFDCKGRPTFLRDRFVRIGIPLVPIVVFMEILVVLTGLNPVTAFSFGWGWFLVLLLILAVAYSVWRTLRITTPPIPCPRNGALLLAALGLSTANFAVRVRGSCAWDYWVLWHVVEPAHVPLYVLFIVGGILAYRNGWLDAVSSSLARTWGIITVVGLCGIPLFIALIGLEPLRGGFTAPALLYSFREAFLSVGICTCLLLVLKHRWNRTGHIKSALAKKLRGLCDSNPANTLPQWRFLTGGILIP